MDEADKVFAGAVPEIYDTLLVPLIFEPYAGDLAARVARSGPRDVLEIAAGTGVLTRAMSSLLGEGISIVATDLNQPMIDKAVKRGTDRQVTWRQADALSLPFEDESFDAVVCQFGVMFFPDRAAAYREARRHRWIRHGSGLRFGVGAKQGRVLPGSGGRLCPGCSPEE
ncbi:MAG: class I SAM-dependent methyltransferase [Gemmatimonadaceae bacterium]